MTIRKNFCVAALAAGLLSWKAAFLFAVPVVPGGTEPYAWYRADAGILDSDGTVTEWQDQSGNNRHLNGTETAKSIGGAPQLTNNGAGGANVVTFDGDDYFYVESTTDWGTASKGWIFAVWQRTGGEGAIYDGDGSAGRQILDTRENEPPVGAAITAIGCCGPIQQAVIADTVGQNVFALTAVDYFGGVGGQERIRINGSAITIPGALDSTGMAGITVGDNKNLNSGWNGDIAELIVFDTNLNLGEVQQIEQALTARWGQSTRFDWSIDGVGDWAVADSWRLGLIGAGAPIANDPNHTAVFGNLITTPTTVVTNANVTLNRVEFNNAVNDYIVAGHGSVNLMAASAASVNPAISVLGTHQFQAIVNLHDDTSADVAGGSTLSFNHELNLMGNTLTKTGTGTVAINNKLTTAGGTLSVQEGTISGVGTIGGDVINNGNISPGSNSSAAVIAGSHSVPEPSALLLVLWGLIGFAGCATQRRQLRNLVP